MRKNFRTYLFSKNIPDESLRQYLMMDEEADFSITKPKYWLQIKEILIKEIEDINKKIITDVTASVGGDTINFAFLVKHVNAIEINKIRYYYLLNNLSVYNLRKKVDTYNKDFTKFIYELKQDIIYIDPPWGGPDYYKEKDIKININEKPLSNIIEDLLNINLCEYVIAKLPFNYKIPESNIYEVKIFKINNYPKKNYFNLHIYMNKQKFRYPGIKSEILTNNPHIRETYELIKSENLYRTFDLKNIQLSPMKAKYRTTIYNPDRMKIMAVLDFLSQNYIDNIIFDNWIGKDNVKEFFPNINFIDINLANEKLIGNCNLISFSSREVSKINIEKWNPKKSLILFYNDKENFSTITFFDGILYYPIWSYGNESFLVTDGKNMKEYSINQYLEKMKYFNRVERVKYYGCETILPEGYDHCYDCISELDILAKIKK